MNPLISLIIPTYNRYRFIGETLNSILNQTYKNWECIIVDDGSRDYSDELLEFYQKRNNRIKFFSRPSTKEKGANACRNFGIQKSKGEYVIFFDSDDLMAPDCLEKRIEYFSSFPDEDMLVFSMAILTEENSSSSLPEGVVQRGGIEEMSEKFIFSGRTPWQICCPIIKASFIKDKIYFNEKMSNFQDDEFYIKLLMSLKPHFLMVPRIDCYYRIHEPQKYSSLQVNQNILNSIYYYYHSIFSVYNPNKLNEIKNRLIFKFFDQVYGYYRKGINPGGIYKTLRLFDQKFKISFSTFCYFKTILFLNTYYFNFKGYYFISKKIKRKIYECI